jgi:hypothetical protein
MILLSKIRIFGRIDVFRKMKIGLAQIILRIAKRLNIYLYCFYFLTEKNSALLKWGWFRCYKEDRLVDSDGNFLPWFTYPAIFFLEQRLCLKMNIFEYGSGSSTVWFARKVGKMISIEHDDLWFNKMKDILPTNVNYKKIPLGTNGEYESFVLNYTEEFDVVIIDGRKRVKCAMNAVKSLKKSGVIIWDDSGREEYLEGYQFLNAHGFRRIDFIGMVPGYHTESCTSIFYRPDNCFNI